MAASYLDHSLSFRIKKVLRYVRLYGISRTLAKVRGQMHMARTEQFDTAIWRNEKCQAPDHRDRIVALIGCGNFAHSALAYYLKRTATHFLRATCDIDAAKAMSMCKDFGGAYATKDIADIIADPAVKLAYIASNHASHAEYAIQFIEAGVSVHIEKPHVVTDEQLERLLAAHSRHPQTRLYLGFNRPKSRHFQRIRDALSKQSGPTMINWFIAGHEIADDHWYFREEEGGRILGNLCHWSDLTLEMVGLENAFPCEIIPASPADSVSDFCIGINFADKSVAGITFSAKGHTFEGVREVLQAHRGNALVKIRDFEESVIEVVEKRDRLKSWHRDHGHGINIIDSYQGVKNDDPVNAVSDIYMAATARLFLGIKRAVDTQSKYTVEIDDLR